MKFEDVLSYRFEDRGFGNCVIWVDRLNEYEITPNGVQKRETVLNAESLFNRIRNLRRQGLDASFEEWAVREVVNLDIKRSWQWALSELAKSNFTLAIPL
jgi:hypothetical protein